MELRMYDGKVRWVKKNGAPAEKPVNVQREIEYLGFPVPEGGSCTGLDILLGDPYKDKRLVVKAGGSNWFGHFLLYNGGDFEKLSYKTPKLIEENKLTIHNAEQYPYKSPQQVRYEAATEIPAENLTEEKGLEVFEDFVKHIGDHIYWIKGRKEFVKSMPEGWVLVQRGDAALTRELCRKHPHWKVLDENLFEHVERLGIFVPGDAYKEVYQKLGGDEGRRRREQKKQQAQNAQEERITEQLKASLCEQFPSLPKDDLEAIVGCARNQGCVGNASFLYFAKKEAKEREFDRAASLAAGAHARHQYTQYDELLREYPKEIAREQTWLDVEDKLSEWRKSPGE